MTVDPNTVIKVLIASGATNIAFLLLLLFSCRCFGASGYAARLFNREWFKRFYAWHCVVWRGLFISVLIHTAAAFYLIAISP